MDPVPSCYRFSVWETPAPLSLVAKYGPDSTRDSPGSCLSWQTGGGVRLICCRYKLPLEGTEPLLPECLGKQTGRSSGGDKDGAAAVTGIALMVKHRLCFLHSAEELTSGVALLLH